MWTWVPETKHQGCITEFSRCCNVVALWVEVRECQLGPGMWRDVEMQGLLTPRARWTLLSQWYPTAAVWVWERGVSQCGFPFWGNAVAWTPDTFLYRVQGFGKAEGLSCSQHCRCLSWKWELFGPLPYIFPTIGISAWPWVDPRSQPAVLLPSLCCLLEFLCLRSSLSFPWWIPVFSFRSSVWHVVTYLLFWSFFVKEVSAGCL